MTKFWIYAVVFLLGSISGIIFWEKYNVNVLYKGVFKLKQRGRGNVQDTNLKLEITPRMKRKQERQEAKDAKKQGKASRRNAKKQRKAEKRLDNVN